MKLTRTAAATALVALAAASTAGAVDDTKPAESCYGKYFTDKAGDNKRGHPAFEGEDGTPNLDLIDGFFKYDAAKKETTVNIRVTDLTKDVPEGSSSAQWQAEWVGSSGALTWVRAVTDFSGLVTYDHGGQETTPANTVNVRKGGTEGAFFEGPQGIVQIVIPADVEPAGTTLKSVVTHAYEPVQAAPGAAPTPVKGGQLYEQDIAQGKGSFTIGSPCPSAPPAAPAPSDAAPGPVVAQTKEAPLPVKVLTKKAKRRKKLTIKLKSSEPITKLAAQLVKGKKVAGKGSLAKINGKGKIKLKTKKLKKGTYRLDLVGTDGKGARRFSSAKLKVS
jgi:hypothetical protein